MISNPKMRSNSLFHEVLGIDALSGVNKCVEFTIPARTQEKRFSFEKSVLFEMEMENFPVIIPFPQTRDFHKL